LREAGNHFSLRDEFSIGEDFGILIDQRAELRDPPSENASEKNTVPKRHVYSQFCLNSAEPQRKRKEREREREREREIKAAENER